MSSGMELEVRIEVKSAFKVETEKMQVKIPGGGAKKEKGEARKARKAFNYSPGDPLGESSQEIE